MAEELVITFEDGGEVSWRDVDEAVGVPVLEVSPWGEDRDPATIVYVNDSRNTLDKQVREMMDAQRFVCEPGGPFAKDWEPVDFRMTKDRGDIDVAGGEIPHIITDDYSVRGAAGHHQFYVTQGGTALTPIAYTDGRNSLPQVQETTFHELELLGNRTTGNWSPLWQSTPAPFYELASEFADPLSGAPHTVRGVKIAAWVTRQYLQGVNGLAADVYDSSRWFGETPRVDGPKGRTAGGFWILRNMTTLGIEYQFGEQESSAVQWGNRSAAPTPPVAEYDDNGLIRCDPEASVHLTMRCLAACRTPLSVPQ